MTALQALRPAVGAVRRNPILVAISAAYGLLQVPTVLVQAINPLLGALLSLGLSALALFVLPFFFGGLIGMANEALDARTSLDTFVREGRANYLSLLVAYLGLLVVNVLLGIGVFVGAVTGGVFLFRSGGEPGLFVVVLAVVGLVFLAGYLCFVFFVQFFGHAIVVDDLSAVEGVTRSVSVVRHNLLAVFGYSVAVGVVGALFGLVGGLFSVASTVVLAPSRPGWGPGMSAPPGVVSGTIPTLFGLDSSVVGAVAVVALAVVLVVGTGLVGGFFAAYSTAFYRSIRPV